MDRPDGYYWIREAPGDNWEPAEWLGEYGHWYVAGSECRLDTVAEVGPRLTPPGPDPVRERLVALGYTAEQIDSADIRIRQGRGQTEVRVRILDVGREETFTIP